MAAPPGRVIPRASVRAAMVLAVPITMQVPALGQREPSRTESCSSVRLPARCSPQYFRQSVQAPSRAPW